VSVNLLHADDRLALASCGAVYISVLRKPLTVEGAAQLRLQARRMATRHGDKHASFSVIEQSAAGAPPPEVREAMSRLAKEFPIICAGIVLEGSGFGPAAIRTLIAGIYLVTKKLYPHKVFDQPRAAATWMVPLMAQTGVTQTVTELVAAVEATRRAITNGNTVK